MNPESEMAIRSRWVRWALEHPYLCPVMVLAINSLQMSAFALTAKSVLPNLRPGVATLVIGTLVFSQIAFLVYFGGVTTWFLRRKAKADSGYSLPEEPRSFLFRPLIWLALLAGTAASLGTALAGAIIHLMSPFIGSHVSGVAGIVGLVMAVRAIRSLYGLKSTIKIYIYLVMPFLLIAVFGILAAIAIPQFQQYERQSQSHLGQEQSTPIRKLPPAQGSTAYFPATPAYRRKITQEVAMKGGYLRHEKEIGLIRKYGHPVPMPTGQCSVELYLGFNGLVQHEHVLRCPNPVIKRYTLEAIRDVYQFPPQNHGTEVFVGISYPWAIPVHRPWRYEPPNP